MKRNRTLVWILIAALALIVSCAKNDDDEPQNVSVPSDSIRISGVVRDTSGSALPGVAIHAVYQITPQSLIREARNPLGSSGLDSAGLVSFEAVGGINQIAVNWITSLEENVNHFEIVRGSGVVGTMQSLGSPGGSYQWMDYNVLSHALYTYSLIAVSAENSRQLLGMDTAMAYDSSGAVPVVFALYQNYPNPVDDTTRIVFDLPQAAHAVLTYSRSDGWHEDTLVDGNMDAGRFTIPFPMNSLPNGRYFYRLKVEDYDKTLMLLKNKFDSTTPPEFLTGPDGQYHLDFAVGDTIHVYDQLRRNLGDDILNKIYVSARRTGLHTADSVITVVGGQERVLNFVLHNE